ncbi:hypothetical protein KEM09_15215 [Carboxylicivirga mesophila]|uniref:AAA domain-containing protein n=1 Tax=Carboxylicivirga mesophila TaxID=1166478 RepID=A0ABS5KE55_9BACT|nr:hypothetical protein [Carboxylicivirga mesophila]MBS2212768.1 hypothetical protein [Carboxylicivirga mesophila]
MNTTNATYRFINNTSFVMGNRKNAGKTTFMNWALNQIRKVEAPAFATIGIDGESHDQIDGRDKPSIKTEPGDVFITSYPMLRKSSGLFKVEKAFQIKTPLGQLVVAKTLRSGTVELVGPEYNEQLKHLIDFIRQELNYRSIIIDGAASRLTPVSAIANSGFYYVVNIDRRNMKKALEQMQLLSVSAGFEMASQDDNAFVIEGALTPGKLSSIPRNCQTVVINDLTAIFLNYEQLQHLQKRVIIKVINRPILKGYVAVLKDIAQEAFSQLYMSKGIRTELILNPYVHQ